jgi:hypothetical protein
VKLSDVPPGTSPAIDAYTLIVAAGLSVTNPDVGQRLVKTVTKYYETLGLWMELSGHMALIAALFAAGQSPDDVLRKIESAALQPADS